MTTFMLIQKFADTYKILDCSQKALTKARTCDPEVRAAAEARLAPAVADLIAARDAWEPAKLAFEAATAAVESQDERCRLRICSIKDYFWTAHGRPRTNKFVTQVFSHGIETYTLGHADDRPHNMIVLQQQLDSCASPKLTADMRSGWKAGLDGDRTSLETLLSARELAKTPAMLAKARFRSSGMLTQEQLRLFKRDLENLGLSRNQIFDIIPDASPTTPRKPQTPPTRSTPPGDQVEGGVTARAR